LRSGPSPEWKDDRLVSECLAGDDRAWSALIDKYKRLIYSVPVKYGLTPDESSDIFQAVCLDLFSDLPQLRKAESLPSWLITVSLHKCQQLKRRERVAGVVQFPSAGPPEIPDHSAGLTLDQLQEVARNQKLREAVEQLPPRCREMIRMLFFETPPVPYDKVAQRLGLALGSIGFIRRRCLDRLQRILEDMDF
jgi:RNA polymerase sigma factor (sigma-70 family)